MADVPVEVKKAGRLRQPLRMCGDPFAAKWTRCSTVRFPLATTHVRYGTGVAVWELVMFSVPAIDMSEDEKADKISAESLVSMPRTSMYRCPAIRSSSRREAPGEGGEGQELLFFRARLWHVPAHLRTAGER